jgi:hypothetical protein
MKIIVKYDTSKFPAVLRMAIHDAPHRRMHRATIQDYRKRLHLACFLAGVPVPLDEVVDVELNFVNPTSPDAGGSYMAWEQAIDGKTLKGPAVFTDDALVGKVTVIRTFPSGAYDARGQVRKKGHK